MQKLIIQTGIILLASILLAFAYNFFLLPFQILSGGVTGIAMIISFITPLNTGLLIFLLNIPIFILGLRELGRRFIVFSILSVFTTSLAMQFIPETPLAKDAMLSSVFGGVLSGLAIGIIFRASASTGGFDIIGLVITKRRDFPMGTLSFAMNALIILISGFLFDWTRALYTLVSIYAAGRVIDTLYTRHHKLTLMIITSKGDEMREMLLKHLVRGITMLDGEGGYTHEKKKVLFTVISRYELPIIKPHILEVDPKAFVDITQTMEVIGAFRRG